MRNAFANAFYDLARNDPRIYLVVADITAAAGVASFQKESPERFLNVGDILIKSSDPTLPEVTLNNVRFVTEVHEILRKAMLDARKKYRYSVQEEM